MMNFNLYLARIAIYLYVWYKKVVKYFTPQVKYSLKIKSDTYHLSNLYFKDKVINCFIPFQHIKGDFHVHMYIDDHEYTVTSIHEKKELKDLGLKIRHTYVLGLPLTPESVGANIVNIKLTSVSDDKTWSKNYVNGEHIDITKIIN